MLAPVLRRRIKGAMLGYRRCQSWRPWREVGRRWCWDAATTCVQWVPGQRSTDTDCACCGAALRGTRCTSTMAHTPASWDRGARALGTLRHRQRLPSPRRPRGRVVCRPWGCEGSTALCRPRCWHGACTPRAASPVPQECFRITGARPCLHYRCLAPVPRAYPDTWRPWPPPCLQLPTVSRRKRHHGQRGHGRHTAPQRSEVTKTLRVCTDSTCPHGGPFPLPWQHGRPPARPAVQRLAKGPRSQAAVVRGTPSPSPLASCCFAPPHQERWRGCQLRSYLARRRRGRCPPHAEPRHRRRDSPLWRLRLGRIRRCCDSTGTTPRCFAAGDGTVVLWPGCALDGAPTIT